MKQQNVIQDKSFAFAIRIVKLCKYLMDEKKEFVLSKQLLRAGTSIGANIEEAIGGQSDRDFFTKLTISYKETRETIYWVRLLAATGFLTENQSDSMLADAIEIRNILGKIQTTLRKKNDSQDS